MWALQIKQQLCFYFQVKILCGIKLKGKKGLVVFVFFFKPLEHLISDNYLSNTYQTLIYI